MREKVRDQSRRREFDQRVLVAAASWIAGNTNLGLSTQIAFLPEVDYAGKVAGSFGLVAEFTELRRFVWWGIGQVLANSERKDLSVCKATDCGQIFLPRDSRQTFCGANCGNRMRVKAWRAQHPKGSRHGKSKTRSRRG